MMIEDGRRFARWSALAAAAMLLSSCVVVEEGPRPGPGPRPPFPDEPRMCTREYAPVCARRGDDRRTFGNSCEARAAGYRILRDGECRRGGGGGGGGWGPGPGGGGGGGWGPGPGPRPDEPRVCTREYRPVCARRGGQVQTFGNACTAEADGFRVISEGECRR